MTLFSSYCIYFHHYLRLVINDIGFPCLLMIHSAFVQKQIQLKKKKKRWVGSPFKIYIREGRAQLAQSSEPTRGWEARVRWLGGQTPEPKGLGLNPCHLGKLLPSL